MKRLITLLLTTPIIMFCLLVVPVRGVLAVDVISPACKSANAANTPTVCKDNQPNPTDNPLFGPHGVLTTGVKILEGIVGVAAVLVILISGIRFITSAGNPESAGKARKALTYGVIGVIIAAMAQAVISFVLNKLG